MKLYIKLMRMNPGKQNGDQRKSRVSIKKQMHHASQIRKILVREMFTCQCRKDTCFQLGMCTWGKKRDS
jgi:hypothetical protein